MQLPGRRELTEHQIRCKTIVAPQQAALMGRVGERRATAGAAAQGARLARGVPALLA